LLPSSRDLGCLAPVGANGEGSLRDCYGNLFLKINFQFYAPRPAQSTNEVIAVGTAIAGRPPHRSVRAELPHTAPPLGSDGRDVAIPTCRFHAFRKVTHKLGAGSDMSAKPHNMPSGGPLSSTDSAAGVPALFVRFSGIMELSAPFPKNTANDVHIGVTASRFFRPIRFHG